MLRHLVGGEGVGVLAPSSAEIVSMSVGAGACADSAIALKVWQEECRRAIAAVGGTKQSEQGLVLIDGHGLAVTEGPTFRRVVESEDSNLTEIGRSHKRRSPDSGRLILTGVDACVRDDVV